MNAIIQIHGREAIPVRALPWLTAWEFSAQGVAEALAHDNGYESFASMEAYRLEDGAIQTVRIGEWLNSVTIRIEEFAERDLPQAEWEKLSLAALPAGVFVWRDEWEPTYNRSPYGPDALAALGDAADEEDVAMRTLNFRPHIPPELVQLVMEGFTQGEATAPASDKEVWPVQRSTSQDAAIMNAIREARCDPLKLPKPPQGKRGIKAEVRAALVGKNPLFPKVGTQFDKAWERLRSQREIADLG
jgi:hypothetical protein